MAPGDAGFLGARYAPMELTTNNMPEFIRQLDGITDLDHTRTRPTSATCSASSSRTAASSDTLGQPRTRPISASAASWRARSSSTSTQEPQKIRDQYGPTQFGEQALIARRLVEAGVPFVRVGRAWWDSHGQNFETHQEMVPELDHVMATLIDDLKDRGLLDDVMIVTLAEFGRTPRHQRQPRPRPLRQRLEHDHDRLRRSRAARVYGKTDAKGNTRGRRRKWTRASLFATIYSALGINPHKNYYVGSRPIPLVNPGVEPIKAVLR